MKKRAIMVISREKQSRQWVGSIPYQSQKIGDYLMASTETSYSFARVMVLVGGTKAKPTRTIVESIDFTAKGLKGNVMTAGKQIKTDYEKLGWVVSLLQNEEADKDSVGRLYIKAERDIGSEHIELYFTSKLGRSSDPTERCPTCAATFEFGKKDFCPNCSALVERKVPEVKISWDSTEPAK